MSIDLTVYLDTVVLNYARRLCKLAADTTEYHDIISDYDALMSEWFMDESLLAKAVNQLKTKARLLNELRVD